MQRPHACPRCDKAFSRKYHLDRHVRTVHDRMMRYTCPRPGCGSRFAERYHMRVHLMHHDGVKQHACRWEGCRKRFVKLWDLKSHMRSHTGEQPYRCERCPSRFSTLSSLIHHKKCHDLPRCVICGTRGVHRYDPSTRAGVMCGVCRVATGRYRRGDKETRVFDYLFSRGLCRDMWSLRDGQIGCGVRKRPDGAMQLKTSMATELAAEGLPVLFQLEIDEHTHVGNTMRCEIVRQQQIRDGSNSAVYLIRYNPDAAGALDEPALERLYDRIMVVLERDHVLALEQPCLVVTEYIGYSVGRVKRLDDTRARLHEEAIDRFTRPPLPPARTGEPGTEPDGSPG